jgi:hypothetical protein
MSNSTMENIIDQVVVDQKKGHFLSAQTLIAIILLLVYTIANPIFEKLNFHYMHESGISMILGLLVALIATLVRPNVSIF